MTASSLLAASLRRGIVLGVREGRLRYDAPEGALTPDLREALVEHKAEIIALLDSAGEPWSPGLDVKIPRWRAIVAAWPHDRWSEWRARSCLYTPALDPEAADWQAYLECSTSEEWWPLAMRCQQEREGWPPVYQQMFEQRVEELDDDDIPVQAVLCLAHADVLTRLELDKRWLSSSRQETVWLPVVDHVTAR